MSSSRYPRYTREEITIASIILNIRISIVQCKPLALSDDASSSFNEIIDGPVIMSYSPESLAKSEARASRVKKIGLNKNSIFLFSL